MIEVLYVGVDDKFLFHDLRVHDRDQRLHEVVTELNQIRTFDLLLGVDVSLAHLAVTTVLVPSIERRLQRVGVNDAEVFEHDETSCGLFVSIVGKLAVGEIEKLVLLCQEVWNHLNQIIVLVLVHTALWCRTPIHKHITLARVPMEVSIQYHLVLVVTRRYQLFGIVDGRM